MQYRSLERLWAEIAIYLEIVELLREDDDELWREYCAWKKLTDKRAKVSP